MTTRSSLLDSTLGRAHRVGLDEHHRCLHERAVSGVKQRQPGLRHHSSSKVSNSTRYSEASTRPVSRFESGDSGCDEKSKTFRSTADVRAQPKASSTKRKQERETDACACGHCRFRDAAPFPGERTRRETWRPVPLPTPVSGDPSEIITSKKATVPTAPPGPDDDLDDSVYIGDDSGHLRRVGTRKDFVGLIARSDFFPDNTVTPGDHACWTGYEGLLDDPCADDSVRESSYLPGMKKNRSQLDSWKCSPVKRSTGSPARARNVEHNHGCLPTEAARRILFDKDQPLSSPLEEFDTIDDISAGVDSTGSEDSGINGKLPYFEIGILTVDHIPPHSALPSNFIIQVPFLAMFSPWEIIVGIPDQYESNAEGQRELRRELEQNFRDEASQLLLPPKLRDLVGIWNPKDKWCHRAVVTSENWEPEQDWCKVTVLDEPRTGQSFIVPLTNVRLLSESLLTDLPCCVCELKGLTRDARPRSSFSWQSVTRYLSKLVLRPDVHLIGRSSVSGRKQVDLYVYSHGRRASVADTLQDLFF